VHPDLSGRKIGFCLEPPPGLNLSPDHRTSRILAIPAAPIPFTSMQNGALEPDVVREAGFLLFRKLSTHPAVETAILSALTHHSLHPIYIHLESEIAAEFPWESLCNPTTGEFLSLGKHWPVGRMIDSSAYEVEHAVEPPVKITAVLAAAGSKPCYGSSCYEWEALKNAISTAKFKVILQVFVSDDDLKQDIIHTYTPPPNVEIQEVNSVHRQEDIQDFFNSIKGFEPNILHFYCHGSTTPNPHLEMASRADCKMGSKYGSIGIEARTLWDAIGDDLKPHIWLVILNCCQGAAQASSHSLASELVERGFPAVIGMRETVTSIDAHAFCEAFYCSFLNEINNKYVRYGRTASKVEWTHLLHEARVRLRDRHKSGRPLAKAESETKEWTLPTIYIRKPDFSLRGCSTNQNLSETEKQVRQRQLDRLNEANAQYDRYTTPPEFFQDLERQIRVLKDELYP
jgi:hypothetical protein